MPSCEADLSVRRKKSARHTRTRLWQSFESANTGSTSHGRVLHSSYVDLVQPSSSEPVVSPLSVRQRLSAETSTEKFVAQNEERNRDKSNSEIAKKPSARNLISPPEGYLQNTMLDPRLQVSELHVDTFPALSTFS